MKRIIVHFVVFSLSVILCMASTTNAQGLKKFAKKGVAEFGGSVSFQSLTVVNEGESGDALTIFSFQPFIGYFVTDGFEIGVNPFGFTSTSYRGSTATEVNIFLAPSYNFATSGSAYPFVEALIGYSSLSNGSSRSGLSWGGRAGVKLAVVENGLLNLGIQYIQQTLNADDDVERNGFNNFAISAGFSIWH